MINTIKRFFNTYIQQTEENPEAPSNHVLQIVTAALLIEMMRADGTTHKDEEQKIVKTIRSRFALSEEESKALIQSVLQHKTLVYKTYKIRILLQEGLYKHLEGHTHFCIAPEH